MRFIKVSAWSKDGNIEFVNVLLPVKRVVCPQCDGSGKHVNPSIDSNGLTADDFAEDPGFAENYFGGAYDVRCETCNGNNVVDEVDEEMCKTRISWWKGLIRYYNALQCESDARMESYYERSAGA